MSTWLEHVEKWKDCTLCPLCEQRDRICLARGAVPCDVLFIGEAPGASEDARGIPFDGPAGKRLDWIIERALEQWTAPGPDHYDIVCAWTNLVACFPAEAKARGDNEPEQGEILACRSRLDEFINVAQPRLIVCVGLLAAGYVSHTDVVPCVDIIHPAATFKMKAVQAQQALQHATIKLRNAVEDMLQKPRTYWSKWGVKYARKSKREQIADAYESAINESDIPF